jgi:hypothetical protein
MAAQRRQPRSPGKQSRGKSESQGNQSPGSHELSHGNQDDSQGNQPSPSDAAAASSTASYAEGSNPLLVNPGPAFEGRDVGADSAVAGDVVDAPGIAGVPLLVDQFWTPERAEYLVKGQGAITHALIGVGESDWVWQPAELAAVAPPLANSLNQVELLRRLAPYADSIGALMGVAAYASRSRRERAAVLAAGGPAREVPVSGVDAAGEPADAAGARRRAVVDRVLGNRSDDRRPSAAPPPQQPSETPGANIDWGLGQ